MQRRAKFLHNAVAFLGAFCVAALPFFAYSQDDPGPIDAGITSARLIGDKGKKGPTRDLVFVYKDALRNDPTFQEQLATYLESREATSQARALLLPELNIEANTTGARQDSTFGGLQKYNANGYDVALIQPVFNANAFKELARAKASVRAAAMLLSSQSQALIVRVVQAYLGVLEAKDLLKYTKQQRDFLWKQLWSTQERYKLGHATITDVDQSKGSYELIRAEYVTARINLYDKIQELSQITGVRYSMVAGLRGTFPSLTPAPNDLSRWVEVAKSQNLALQAARLDRVTAAQVIGKTKADFWPVVNAAATWGDSNGLSGAGVIDGLVPENTRTGTIGLNLTWSAFQSGFTLSQVRQANAAYQAATARVHQSYLAAIANTRKAYIGVMDGQLEVRRSWDAITANENALKNTQEGYNAGTHTIFDVLQSQTRLFDSQKQYVQSLYAYLLNTILLKQAVGTLSPSTVVKMNAWFTSKKSFKRKRNKWHLYNGKTPNIKSLFPKQSDASGRPSHQIKLSQKPAVAVQKQLALPKVTMKGLSFQRHLKAVNGKKAKKAAKRHKVTHNKINLPKATKRQTTAIVLPKAKRTELVLPMLTVKGLLFNRHSHARFVLKANKHAARRLSTHHPVRVTSARQALKASAYAVGSVAPVKVNKHAARRVVLKHHRAGSSAHTVSKASKHAASKVTFRHHSTAVKVRVALKANKHAIIKKSSVHPSRHLLSTPRSIKKTIKSVG